MTRLFFLSSELPHLRLALLIKQERCRQWGGYTGRLAGQNNRLLVRLDKQYKRAQ